ncbi:MAG: iron-containing alcohol dehydrogenase [Thermomicrobiales bacterium]|nr:iron-containing alcohol dehydrogenase [Thermomicrobiales bacterium]
MAPVQEFQFLHGTKVVAGPGSAGSIGEELRGLGATRALIVTDRGVAGAGLLASVVEGLERAGVTHEVFDEVEPNPLAETTDRGAARARAGGCDAVIAVGGGSSIDCAKVIAVIGKFGGAARDYEGFDTVPDLPLPLVAVPTTVGTGSEVTRGAVISDAGRRLKMVVVTPRIFPRIAVLDPLLLMQLPAPVTAATGMDSLTQAIEGYVSRNASPITDALNLEALRMIAANLRLAVARNDLAALAALQIATTMQGIGFHNAGLGLVHAMSNTVGGIFGAPHGVTNAIILPHVMEFNLAADPVKFARVAEAMGEPVAGLSVREAAERSVAAVRVLSSDIRIPPTLADVGVTAEAIPEMTEKAMRNIDAPTNPRNYSEADIAELYRRCLKPVGAPA